MKRERFEDAANRHLEKKYFKANAPLSQHLTKAKTLPNVTESKPVQSLIPSGTRKVPVGKGKEELMKFLKRMGTSA